MIISHQHRFIFFAIPKTGTHSVRRALRLHLGPQDLEQVGLFVEKRFPFPEFAGIQHGHISAREIRPVLGDQAFRSYFKFAFVRNPFDRFVSYCAFMGREGGAFEAAPRDFMKQVAADPGTLDHLLFRPQHEFITDENGRLALDYMGRTEDVQGSFEAICRKLKLPASSVGRVNSSRHRPYAEYYDDALAGTVREIYRRDFELFAYDDKSPT